MIFYCKKRSEGRGAPCSFQCSDCKTAETELLINNLEKVNAEKAAREVTDALNNFPSYVIFAVGERGGFVIMNSVSEAQEKKLFIQIVNSLRSRPELENMFKQVINNL